MNVDQRCLEFELFCRSLNRDGITVQETVDAINEHRATLDSDLERSLFNDTVYNNLWVEPENLAKRRVAGELDNFFRG
jgi:hypothetical protein